VDLRVDRLDLLLSQSLAHKPSKSQLRVLRAMTELGGPVVVTSTGTGLIVWLLSRGRRRDALRVWSTVFAGSLARYLLHLVVARPRPKGPHIHVTGNAFPSGHTTAAALLYGQIARLAGGGAWWIPAALAVSAVGTSRVLLRVHWLTDVIAGVAFAAGWRAGVELILGARSPR
jgi:undecaprenyl-diphosphatase